MIPEVLDREDPALADRLEHRHFHIGLWSLSLPPPKDSHGNPVANVDEITDRLDGVALPCLAHLRELAHDRLSAEVRAWLRPTLNHPDDHVGVIRLTDGIHVPRVPSLESGPHDLHVLLRHRLRSIAVLQTTYAPIRIRTWGLLLRRVCRTGTRRH